MKLLLLNGSPHENGCTATALREVGRTLEALGIETETHWVGREPVPSCIACGGCKKTGTCIYDDGVNRILERSEEWDGLVVGSPVYYGCASGQVTASDRSFLPLAGDGRGKVAAAVVSCRRGGASTAFQQLNLFFGMNNLVVATSQYWNQVHGNTPQEVAQDLEGLQTMRTLARNLAWILRCREAAALPAPEREPVTPTNFIR